MTTIVTAVPFALTSDLDGLASLFKSAAATVVIVEGFAELPDTSFVGGCLFGGSVEIDESEPEKLPENMAAFVAWALSNGYPLTPLTFVVFDQVITALALSGALTLTAKPVFQLSAGYPPFVSTITLIPAMVLKTVIDRSVTYYLCKLTGSADGLSDVTIPISSFQARMRNGDPSYLAVVVPGVDYSDEITARSNGEIQVQMAFKKDGVLVQAEIIARATLEEIRVDEGANNKSITLGGHRTETLTAPQTITLSGLMYRNTWEGKKRVRTLPHLYLRPGDTVVAGEWEFTADLISYFVSVGRSTMEVSEAS